ncbi:PRC-barrel domain-containing protein [Jidongwangia harbinensis]|uniref:PRC-barrel domain-containing protein n=1 Tax=Jidongwangia harbinensis TaxID=2878561 RepID=UPI001CD963E5|nr:PRC-barrel domain-containing protein [Jidongwangia harbinensis]MCA2219030.1 PRC-barrel domain-containing protein [Jidongwangia harbinensis]
MASRSTTSLVKLSDSDQILADPTEDIRGRKVEDRNGEDLGKVDDLLIDAEEGRIRFLRVEHGGILGIGATASFIPIDAITRIAEDTVYVGESRERVGGAPQYDPDLIDGSQYYDSLYGYYGYPPSWGASGIYPGMPHGRA